MGTGEVSDQILQWLLEPSDPSIQYWALKHLLNKEEKDPVVIAARNAVMESECVKHILRSLKPEGYWESSASIYLPKYTATTHNLLILSEFGITLTDALKKAIEHVFLYQRDSGHFLMDIPKTDKGRASTVKDGCCYDGNILWYLIHFGYLDDARTQKLIQFQIDYHSDDVGGWKCRAFPINPSKVFPENCFMGAVKMLKALSSIPPKKRPREIERIIQQEVEIILENQNFKYLKTPDGKRKEKAGWKRFGFPLFYQSDILEVLDVLTNLGIKDDRMQESIDIVESAKGEDGKWVLKNSFNGKMLCDIDTKGEPSKWITLRASRVLKRYFGE
ncbi:MAG: nitrogen fixation protein NifH [Candidatus Thorarchaeota archaeon]|nr:nitrogen fixation protein NifH [Candidatus Thorarchaeota archaeon]